MIFRGEKCRCFQGKEQSGGSGGLETLQPHPSRVPILSVLILSPLPGTWRDPAVLIHSLFIQKIREMIKGFQRKPRARGEDEWELIEAASLRGRVCTSPAPLSSATEPQIFLCRVPSSHPAQSKAGCSPCAEAKAKMGAGGRASGCATALEECAMAAGAG